MSSSQHGIERILRASPLGCKAVKGGYTHIRQTQVCDQTQYPRRYPAASDLKSNQTADAAHCE